jgi:hypothetical protein
VSISAPSLADNAALLVAALDLKLVTLLTGAMRAVDANATKDGRLIVPEDRYEPRQVIHPEPRYLPRPVIHPEPRFEPRPIVHPLERSCKDFNPAKAPCAPEPPTCSPNKPISPIQPPWKVLPWPAQEVRRPVKVVKVLQPQPDNTCRGTILDRFL